MKSRKIVVIDYQETWRRRFETMLTEAGYQVETVDTYDDYPPPAIQAKDRPDLIILSCGYITTAEVELISRALAQKLHLVVLSTALPWQDMRRLFLAGAEDVTEKPYTKNQLINIIEEAIRNTTSVDSYQAVKQEGRM